MTKISIIIPMLNEADNIKNLLDYLSDNVSRKNNFEIIVVDGGSTDGSQEIVADLNYLNVIHSKKGRAKQMNIGAKAATGNILYFLHADSFPPKNFDQFILDEIEKGNSAGCFRMQFKSSHWWLQFVSWFTKFNWKACRGGDQSLFVTKQLFNEIGGFNENYMIYEDILFIHKLYAKKQFVVINKKLKTSARLYEKNGVWKLQYHFLIIYLKKGLGASAEELLRYYKKHIS